MHDSTTLRKMAELYGIQPSYDLAGGHVQVGEEAMQSILAAAGANEHNLAPPLPRVRNSIQPEASSHRFDIDLPDGVAPNAVRTLVRLEDGTTVQIDPSTHTHGHLSFEIHDLPVGYHRINLRIAGTGHSRLVMIHPRRAVGMSGRQWGLFMPIHALRSGREYKGAGDFGDLRRLMEWTGKLGGSVVATLPFLAGYLDKPCEPSPYSPVSRLFWNEFFIETDEDGPVQASAGGDAVVGDDFVDYMRVMAIKRVTLEAKALAFFAAGEDRRPEFKQFVEERPELEQYAAFRAVQEARGGEDWRLWPDGLRQGPLDTAAVPQEAYRYHICVQWLAEKQLKRLSESTGSKQLYLDLPLGVHAGGFDTWRYQELFVEGASLGAPPDLFFTAGQNWGLAPLDPHRLERSGFKYFIEVIRHHCRQAGMLRLDHIMGLHRMFWIPKESHACDGAYVRYPAEALYAILLIEASRTGTVLVGEDLGTVPPECRHMMHERGIHGMHVVQFGLDPWSDDPVVHPPEGVVLSLNTHDLPPWKAFIEGLDLDEAAEMGLMTLADAADGKKHRGAIRHKVTETLRWEGRLPDDFEGRSDRDKELEVLRGLLIRLAEGNSPLLMISLEDLWLETERQNLPGTGPEKPNWRHRSARTMEEFMADPWIRSLLESVAAARTGHR